MALGFILVDQAESIQNVVKQLLDHKEALTQACNTYIVHTPYRDEFLQLVNEDASLSKLVYDVIEDQNLALQYIDQFATFVRVNENGVLMNAVSYVETGT